MFNFREKQHQERQAREILTGDSASDPHGARALNLACLSEVSKIREMPLEARAEYKKAQFLPKFLPLVMAFYEEHQAFPRISGGYCLVYLLDAEDFERAIPLADQMLAVGAQLPPEFYRSPCQLVADELLEWTNRESFNGHSVQPYFNAVFSRIFSEGWEVGSIARGKWLKKAAQLLITDSTGEANTTNSDDPDRLQMVLQLAHSALVHHNKVNVHTLIRRTEMRLRALAKRGKEPTDPADFRSDSAKGFDLERALGFLTVPPTFGGEDV